LYGIQSDIFSYMYIGWNT